MMLPGRRHGHGAHPPRFKLSNSPEQLFTRAERRPDYESETHHPEGLKRLHCSVWLARDSYRGSYRVQT